MCVELHGAGKDESAAGILYMRGVEQKLNKNNSHKKARVAAAKRYGHKKGARLRVCV
jgi:hypothetical protein